jgi:hypothetical protein
VYPLLVGKRTPQQTRDTGMSAQDGFFGVINPEELYTLDALKRRLAIRDATLRAARRAGLQVHYKHGRGFVYGHDWINYVCSPVASTEPAEASI